MTPQDINEAVARELGYVSASQVPGIYYADYCHSIAAAWEILNRPHVYYSIMSGESVIQAIINNKMAEADTAPMAICLAFLKLQEAKNESV